PDAAFHACGGVVIADVIVLVSRHSESSCKSTRQPVLRLRCLVPGISLSRTGRARRTNRLGIPGVAGIRAALMSFCTRPFPDSVIYILPVTLPVSVFALFILHAINIKTVSYRAPSLCVP